MAGASFVDRPLRVGVGDLLAASAEAQGAAVHLVEEGLRPVAQPTRRCPGPWRAAVPSARASRGSPRAGAPARRGPRRRAWLLRQAPSSARGGRAALLLRGACALCAAPDPRRSARPARRSGRAAWPGGARTSASNARRSLGVSSRSSSWRSKRVGEHRAEPPQRFALGIVQRVVQFQGALQRRCRRAAQVARCPSRGATRTEGGRAAPRGRSATARAWLLPRGAGHRGGPALRRRAGVPRAARRAGRRLARPPRRSASAPRSRSAASRRARSQAQVSSSPSRSNSLRIAARKERARFSVVVTNSSAGQKRWRSRHASAFAYSA